MKDTSGHSKNRGRSKKNGKRGRGSANEEEDCNCSYTKVCDCDMCPDLAKDVSFNCCKSVSKARSICQQENLSCICLAKKIEKLLDKAST